MVRPLGAGVDPKPLRRPTCRSGYQEDREPHLWAGHRLRGNGRRLARQPLFLQSRFRSAVFDSLVRDQRARGVGIRVRRGPGRGCARLGGDRWDSLRSSGISTGDLLRIVGGRLVGASGRFGPTVREKISPRMRAASSIAAAARWVRPGGIAILLPLAAWAVLAAVPWIGVEPNLVRLLFITFIWTITGIAWNLLGGFAGQVSFGFAVFYGLGAYTTALLINDGVHPYLAFGASALVASLASLIVGIPTFRLRGPYFAIATIGVSETVRV